MCTPWRQSACAYRYPGDAQLQEDRHFLIIWSTTTTTTTIESIHPISFTALARMSINPLSNPKGVKLLCELCQKPAFVQCTQCRVTYYW